MEEYIISVTHNSKTEYYNSFSSDLKELVTVNDKASAFPYLDRQKAKEQIQWLQERFPDNAYEVEVK
jgi:hypothetical protein